MQVTRRLPSSRWLDELAFLSRQVASWAAAPSLDDLLRRAAGFFSSYYDEAFVLFGLIEDAQLIVKTWSIPPQVRVRPGTIRLPLNGRGITLRAARSGKAVRVSDVAEDADYVPLYEGSPVRSELAVPLRMGEEVIGVIDLESPKPSRFTARDETLLEALGTQLGFCIEHVRVVGRLERTLLQTVTAMSAMVEGKDDYTEGHCQRIAEMALSVGIRLGLPQDRLNALMYAGILHDIGKVGIPDAILGKPGRLTDKEFEIMKTHPTIGREILEKIEALRDVAEIVEQHHERYDGTGYPRGLSGEEIRVEARILAVVDAYDAMTSTRPYRRARRREDAVAELRRCAGHQFDPRIVEVFLASLGGDGLPMRGMDDVGQQSCLE
ncbi:MAG TPA: HD domain-containing phosphohydrolase [Bacillota bacterium]